MAHQISSSCGSVRAVRPQRTCSVAVSASKDWKKAAAATLAGMMVFTATPCIAAQAISEEELLEKVKVRVCNELPTNSICIPKRKDFYKTYVEPKLPK